jgi:hypothetical protein
MGIYIWLSVNSNILELFDPICGETSKFYIWQVWSLRGRQVMQENKVDNDLHARCFLVETHG